MEDPPSILLSPFVGYKCIYRFTRNNGIWFLSRCFTVDYSSVATISVFAQSLSAHLRSWVFSIPGEVSFIAKFKGTVDLSLVGLDVVVEKCCCSCFIFILLLIKNDFTTPKTYFIPTSLPPTAVARWVYSNSKQTPKIPGKHQETLREATNYEKRSQTNDAKCPSFKST